jgi:1,4-dihydroxy-2-naphthoate octaprenyltransferase
VAAGLGLGGLAVAGTALVQDGSLGPTAWATAVPAFGLTFNLLLLNEFPDETADREGGRRNLVLLLGRRRAAQLYVVVALCVPLAILAAVLAAALPAAALIAVVPSVFLLEPLRWAARDPQSPVPVPALGANVLRILATNSLLAAALAASVLI